jgi:hypothetical protein
MTSASLASFTGLCLARRLCLGGGGDEDGQAAAAAAEEEEEGVVYDWNNKALLLRKLIESD